jgi:hypothetical protein
VPTLRRSKCGLDAGKAVADHHAGRHGEEDPDRQIPVCGELLIFDTNQQFATDTFNEPRYLEIIRPDEHKFAELADCISLVTQEGRLPSECGKGIKAA